MIRYLCDSGVDPEAVREAISWRPNALRFVAGTLPSKEFEKALAGQMIAEGNKPYTNRYFIEEDELIRAHGSTYAVTKMWGPRTAKAMDDLVSTFRDENISYREST